MLFGGFDPATAAVVGSTVVSGIASAIGGGKNKPKPAQATANLPAPGVQSVANKSVPVSLPTQKPQMQMPTQQSFAMEMLKQGGYQ
jgi:hypothetical protein